MTNPASRGAVFARTILDHLAEEALAGKQVNPKFSAIVFSDV